MRGQRLPLRFPAVNGQEANTEIGYTQRKYEERRFGKNQNLKKSPTRISINHLCRRPFFNGHKTLIIYEVQET